MKVKSKEIRQKMETVINKPRRGWVAGMLTILAIGLGHIYSGEAKKGLTLFLLQFSLPVIAIFLYLVFERLPFLLFPIAIGIVFVAYCFIDAIKKAKTKRGDYHLKKYNRWYVYIICLLLSSIISLTFQSAIKRGLLQAYRVPAGSMLPTIRIGDHILTNKFIYTHRPVLHGDVIVFPTPEDPTIDYIKRVIALEGDEITIINKEVVINGGPLSEPYIQFNPQNVHKKLSPRDHFGPVTVPSGKAFVMGDNRDNSYDSRFFGFIDIKSIKGKVGQIYWSWDHETNSVRWDRIGKEIH